MQTRVYALAHYLGLPGIICNTKSTTDTYSLPPAQGATIYRDIEAKCSTTRYLHMPPVLIELVREIH